jgi:hypothetical protein
MIDDPNGVGVVIDVMVVVVVVVVVDSVAAHIHPNEQHPIPRQYTIHVRYVHRRM